MISRDFLTKMATEWQTTELNVAREYCQHLILEALYQTRNSERILFKGGTALRLVYQSPRFSEDLDFSSDLESIDLEKSVLEALARVELQGTGVDISESKKTSGGYLIVGNFRVLDYSLRVLLEISLRGKGLPGGSAALVSSRLAPPYLLFHLPPERLVEEKLQALLTRKKPRDFFDLYFILRSDLLRKTVLPHANLLQKIIPLVSETEIDWTGELKVFLPFNQQRLLTRFTDLLKTALAGYE